MNKIWKIFVISGVAMFLAAVLLCVYNFHESNVAYQNSQTALSGLKNMIPDIPPETYSEHLQKIQEKSKRDVLAESEARQKEKAIENGTYEMPSVELDGQYYCGYLTIESLALELPVLNEWSYSNLNIAPCRYEGAPESRNFIIAAHNYNSHFGMIKNLSDGDELVFTNCNGEKFHYVVSYTEYIDGYSVEQMSENDSTWDMTLFTCTLNGQSRVTVRAKLIED
ncbi:MAG: sortase [Prevotella sp.]|nr:sortase [Alistipes senegalensis]MCM1357484.1 sortase [Prevotella sp.]